MFARFLFCVILTSGSLALGQELTGDEAAEFLKIASAKIKANCDAIQSWQAKVMAKLGKQHSQGEFTLAENGDWLLAVESTTGSSSVLTAEPAPVRTNLEPLRLEFFSHGLTLDKALLTNDSRRIINQTPLSKTPAYIDIACPVPLCLFQLHQNRFDDVLLNVAKSTSGQTFSFAVTKPFGGEQIWTVTVKKTMRSIRTSFMEETWRLDESKAFLPISHQFKLGNDRQENTYEYEAVDGIYLPKKAMICDQSNRATEFQIETKSLNRGPQEVTPTYTEGDRLNDLSGKRFIFKSGEFRPAEGELSGATR